MHLIYANNPSRWNAFLFKNKGSILQSWQWGDVEGGALKLKIQESNQTLAQALFIEKKLILDKKYYYCPWGPIIDSSLSSANLRSKIINLFIQEIKKKKDCLFIRFEPQKNFFQVPPSLPIKKTKNIQPQKIWVLNLEKPLNKILIEMKSKTRYNIRLAQRKGVKVKMNNNKKSFKIFWHLLQQTSQRHQFKIHPQVHYQKIIKFLSKDHLVQLFIAFYKNKALAAALVSFFGEEAYYLHGGSSLQYKNLMAPHLLHWQIIQEAQRKGCKFYNFGGIEEKGWEGITRFKKGFGGEKKTYPSAQDVILNKKWYKIYRIGRKLCNLL